MTLNRSNPKTRPSTIPSCQKPNRHPTRQSSGPDTSHRPTRSSGLHPTPTANELSYVEDQGQRQIYRVRTMATLVGIVVLAIALIWAIGQSLGALGDWWDSFFGNLRL